MLDIFKNLFKPVKQEKVPLPFEGKSILIVEDNDVDRRILSDLVAKQGFTCFFAVNGEEGLRKTKEISPDLILLDCEMPQMNGPEMCRLLKNSDSLKHIPVIFITSVDTPKNVIECYDSDAEHFLAKPINPRVLISHIESVFKEKTSIL